MIKKLLGALVIACMFASCAPGAGDTDPNTETPPGGEEWTTSLVGTYWWWPSLQLFFISENRVMLYSTGAYYPYEDYPFQYTFPAPGYAYSYTYDPANRHGSINDIGEYSGGNLGAFRISEDKQTMLFPNYKSYGHNAEFSTLRPAPAAGYQLSALPDNLHNTVWYGIVPGTDLGGFTGNPAILQFTGSQVYVTRTYGIDKDNPADTQRLFQFTISGANGTITGIGDFTLNGANNTIHFDSFFTSSVDFKRIN